jgi:hypothetical protein
VAIVRKMSIGVRPVRKMFRVPGIGGEAADAILSQAELPEGYFNVVGSSTDRKVWRLSNDKQSNFLALSEESVVFVRNYYASNDAYDFTKVLSEFRAIWSALQPRLNVRDIRCIGIVCEYRFSVGATDPSVWLRRSLTKLNTDRHTQKFNLRFEDRDHMPDGKAPDPKRSDFINYIYQYYDSALDVDHPASGFVDVDLDVQRYFAPVVNPGVADEVMKLNNKFFEPAEKRLDEHMKSLGAANAKA